MFNELLAVSKAGSATESEVVYTRGCNMYRISFIYFDYKNLL